MATLQKIRSKGPLLALVIGFALLAFILGDLLSNSSSLIQGDRTTVAEINGDKVDIKDFQTRLNDHKAFIQFANQVSSLNQEQEKRIREEVWNMIVREKVLGENLDDMGLRVSDKEVTQLIIGNSRQVDPIMQQIAIFMNRETRQFAPQMVRQFFNTYINSNDESKQFGIYLEEIIRRNKARDKYQTLIAKGLNVTKPEAVQLFKDRVNSVDFEYVMLNYKSISDEDITVSDKDLKAYYEEHKEEYQREHSRDLAYVTFDIVPSADDRKETKEEVVELSDEFKLLESNDVEGMINFANANSDLQFINKYYSEGEFPVVELDSLLFNAEIGFISEVYEHEGNYKVARLTEKSMIPDTVQISHIVLAPDGSEVADMDAAVKRIDSLKTVIENGGDFAKLADEYSMDTKSALKGGDLGKLTPTDMNKAMSDSCFYANVGDLTVVEADYGVHLIKITYQSEKRMKILPAIVSKKIESGKKTIDQKYVEIVKFATASKNPELFDKEVEKAGLTKKIANDLDRQTEVIAGLENPDRILSWAMKDDTETGVISDVFQSGQQFIVAIVTDIKEEGTVPFEDKKKEITVEVVKKKKADKLSANLKKALAGDDLKAASEKTSGIFNVAKNISFSSSAIPNVGNEPKVIGTAVTLEKGKTSDIIVGENGVFVVKPTIITARDEVKEEETLTDKLNAQRQLSFRASRGAYEALKEKAEIEDKRYKFF
ncbi:MAG: SurA N-terminal domain-containing protein [Bacteroidota bacterium]|nr:SurA N-terminal domain-containing protein [Bacteroidota bacterium]